MNETGSKYVARRINMIVETKTIPPRNLPLNNFPSVWEVEIRNNLFFIVGLGYAPSWVRPGFCFKIGEIKLKIYEVPSAVGE